jgi:hypothetical protein
MTTKTMAEKNMKSSATSEAAEAPRSEGVRRSIGDDPAFTHALAALTACEFEMSLLDAGSAEEEHSPSFRAASDANRLAWDAVVACADAFAARSVVHFVQ